MTYTDNLNLNKPDPDDFYNIDDMNENMEIIDDMAGDVAQLKIDITKAELTGKELTTQEYDDGIEAGTITDHDDIDYYLSDYEIVPTNSYMINHHDSTVGETLDAHSDEIVNLSQYRVANDISIIPIGSSTIRDNTKILKKANNEYYIGLMIVVSASANTEVQVAKISKNSMFTSLTGAVIQTQNSKIIGGFSVTSDGGVYINLTESLTNVGAGLTFVYATV